MLIVYFFKYGKKNVQSATSQRPKNEDQGMALSVTFVMSAESISG